MKHLVYKTTNLVNGKFYIGVHSNEDPNYLGSGTALKAAIKKYGRENFVRKTLKTFSTRKEALAYEKQIVNPFDRDNYNLVEGGGSGHWSNNSIPVKLNGKAYPSLREAQRNTGLRPETIKKMVSGTYKPPGSHRARAMKCRVDGIDYPSYREAAKQLNVCHHTAKKRCELRNQSYLSEHHL